MYSRDVSKLNRNNNILTFFLYDRYRLCGSWLREFVGSVLENESPLHSRHKPCSNSWTFSQHPCESTPKGLVAQLDTFGQIQQLFLLLVARLSLLQANNRWLACQYRSAFSEIAQLLGHETSVLLILFNAALLVNQRPN